MDLIIFITAIIFIISYITKAYLHEKLIKKTSSNDKNIMEDPLNIELIFERAKAGSFFPINLDFKEKPLNQLKNNINKLLVLVWLFGGLLLVFVVFFI